MKIVIIIAILFMVMNLSDAHLLRKMAHKHHLKKSHKSHMKRGFSDLIQKFNPFKHSEEEKTTDEPSKAD